MSQIKAQLGARGLSQLKTARLFAHRTNVDRYKKMLGTDLTDNERAFVEQRLAEEQVALAQVIGEIG